MSSSQNVRYALKSAATKLLLRFMGFLLGCLLFVELVIGAFLFYDLYRSDLKMLHSMASEYQRILKYDSSKKLIHVLEGNPRRLVDNNITVFSVEHHEDAEASFIVGDKDLVFDRNMLKNCPSASNWLDCFLFSPYFSQRLAGDTQDFFLLVDNRKRHHIAFDRWQMTFYAMFVMLIVTAVFTRKIIHSAMMPLATLGDLLDKLKRGQLESVEIAENPEGLNLISSSVHDAVLRLQQITMTLNTTVDAIAHDVRTPLSRIILSSQTALMNESDVVAMREALVFCSEHAHQANNMLTTLMKLNDENLGKRTQQIVETNLVDIVRKISGWYEEVAEQKNIKLVVESSKDEVVYSDPDKLTQILVNLVDNAIKYTPQGGTVTIKIHQSEENRVAISVVDTGIGIDSEYHNLIFERLYRVDSSRNNVEGYGLGLSLAVAMVANLDGEIELSSKLGEGSIFRLTLPR